MLRCLELAQLGAGQTAPNPLVGAVLVHNGMIIGEGYHEKYGQAHAEVNCINQALRLGHSALIPASVMYVSLEPCAHFGKTPPCADLIVKHKIPKVVIGCRDPFKEVDGRGIEKLKAAGTEVITGILEDECTKINKRFFTFHIQQRPYVILKWAQTADGFIASSSNFLQKKVATDTLRRRLRISNEYSNRLVHKWRSEEASIMVGTNTALDDNPELTTRLWPGNSPVRLIVDMQLRLPPFLKIFDQKVKTIVFNAVRQDEKENLLYFLVQQDTALVQQVLHALYQLNIQSVMVEGGARLLQSFIDAGTWDEARVISNGQFTAGRGLPAPVLGNVVLEGERTIFSDTIRTYKQ